MKGSSIAGRKGNDGIDFYQTPTWVTRALLEREKFTGLIIEPCNGDGAISDILEEYITGCDSVIARSDIREDINIMSYARDCCDHVITNPPYNNAQIVIEQSLKMARGKVAMLLKLSFLESQRRYDFFKNTPLKTVYVFCRRVNMYPANMEKPKNGGTIAYAWYIWERGYKDKPQTEWIL